MGPITMEHLVKDTPKDKEDLFIKEELFIKVK